MSSRSAIGVAYVTYVATIQRTLFDDGILKGDLGVVLRIIATLVVLFVLTSLIALRQNYATAQVSQGVLRDIRLRIFALIQRLDPAFFQRMQTGDILSRVTSDLAMIEFPVGSGLAQGVRMLLMLVLAVGALVGLSPRFALVLLVATPLLVLTGRYLGPVTARASRQRQQNLGAVTSTIQENLGAQAVVKAFGLENLMIERYARQLDTLFASAIHFSVLTGLTGLAAQSITTAIQLLALGLGAWLVIARLVDGPGGMDPGRQSTHRRSAADGAGADGAGGGGHAGDEWTGADVPASRRTIDGSTSCCGRSQPSRTRPTPPRPSA